MRRAFSKALVPGLVVAAAVVLPFRVSDFRTFQLTLAICFITTLLGLNLLTGYVGIISLATGAFFGIGAYTVVIFYDRFGSSQYAWDPIAYLGIPAAAVITFVLGWLLGRPTVRLRGWNLVLVTVGIAVAFSPVVKRYDDLTGGAMGMQMVKPTAPGWSGLSDDDWIYFVALGVCSVLFLVYWRVVRGLLGRSLLASKEHELGARALGIDTAQNRVVVFALSAAYAGAGGALYGLTVQSADPESFALLLAIHFLLGAVVGGVGSVVGPILGGLFLEFMKLYAQDVFSEASGLVYGLMLIATMYLAPTGLAGLGARLYRRTRRGSAGREELAEAGDVASMRSEEPLEVNLASGVT